MRTSSNVYGAEAGSSISDEESGFKEEHNASASTMRNRQDDSNSRPGSQRFEKSSRNKEETRNSSYYSDSSFRTIINPIQYTYQHQAEFVRKLKFIKDLRRRGNANVVDKPKDSAQLPMGFHGHGPSYDNPCPEPFPYGMYTFPYGMYPYPEQVVKSVRRRVKGAKVPPSGNSNLLELVEYSDVNQAALTYRVAQIGYNNQESNTKQDTLKPEPVATEVSEDSRISKTSKEKSRPRNRKESSEYSFSEVTNKIISSDQNNKQSEVWVNGHLISEDMVISAEKLAGRVQAGKYWYDYLAGFWGVMGDRCLGIIPPYIQEFILPMPDNCCAGNTSVFVNGRELHERDLDLLSGRGLPRDKNRSYIVNVSGRVLDGDSGEELESLGKLAVTIEKVKHGFGMRVPKSLVS